MLGGNCFRSLDTGLHLGVILTKEEATDCWRFFWQSTHFMLTWTHECKWSPIIFVVLKDRSYTPVSVVCGNTVNLAIWKLDVSLRWKNRDGVASISAHTHWTVYTPTHFSSMLRQSCWLLKHACLLSDCSSSLSIDVGTLHWFKSLSYSWRDDWQLPLMSVIWRENVTCLFLKMNPLQFIHFCWVFFSRVPNRWKFEDFLVTVSREGPLLWRRFTLGYVLHGRRAAGGNAAAPQFSEETHGQDTHIRTHTVYT